MKTKFFRKNNQRRTILSPEGHLSGRAATLSRVAHLSCLLVLLTATFCVSAQNGVTVSGLAVNAGTVTFNVSWETPMPVEPWSDTVWVFVDYNNEGKMERLPLAPGATLTATSAPGSATVIQYPDNDKGVWVVGNAKTSGAGSFSATVQLSTATINLAGACVYASNYPPVGKYTSVNTVRFTGTPPYYLTYSTGGTATVYREQAGGDYSLSAPLASFTDATGAPGVFSCSTPAVQTLSASGSSYCAGSGVTLALDGTEFGATYQLYENNVPQSGATLTGTDAAATFTGLFGAGIYSVQTVSDDHYCPAEMNGMITVTERALPDTPTAIGGYRCNAGAVTIYAEAANSNIYWFENRADTYNVSGMTASNTFTTPELSTTTTYYAAAEDKDSGCLSSNAAAVTASIRAPAGVNQAFDPACGCPDNMEVCNGKCFVVAGTYNDCEDMDEGKCVATTWKACNPNPTVVRWTLIKQETAVWSGYMGQEFFCKRACCWRGATAWWQTSFLGTCYCNK